MQSFQGSLDAELLFWVLRREWSVGGWNGVVGINDQRQGKVGSDVSGWEEAEGWGSCDVTG